MMRGEYSTDSGSSELEPWRSTSGDTDWGVLLEGRCPVLTFPKSGILTPLPPSRMGFPETEVEKSHVPGSLWVHFSKVEEGVVTGGALDPSAWWPSAWKLGILISEPVFPWVSLTCRGS